MSILVVLHCLQGLREARVDARLAAEFNASRTRPALVILLLIAFFGTTGFLFALYPLSSMYTKLVAPAETRQFTVSSSKWTGGRRFPGCNRTIFEERPPILGLKRSVCLPTLYQPGNTISVSVQISGLGTYIRKIE